MCINDALTFPHIHTYNQRPNLTKDQQNVDNHCFRRSNVSKSAQATNINFGEKRSVIIQNYVPLCITKTQNI